MDGALWIEDAIFRIDWPPAKPRESCSRSDSLRPSENDDG
jgi:hypothetical protein